MRYLAMLILCLGFANVALADGHKKQEASNSQDQMYEITKISEVLEMEDGDVVIEGYVVSPVASTSNEFNFKDDSASMIVVVGNENLDKVVKNKHHKMKVKGKVHKDDKNKKLKADDVMPAK